MSDRSRLLDHAKGDEPSWKQAAADSSRTLRLRALIVEEIRCALLSNEAASPWLNCREAAAYLRFRNASSLRTAVMRKEIRADGIGPRNTLLFRRETLDQYVLARSASRHATAGTPGRNEQ